MWIEVVPEKSTKGDKEPVVSGNNLKKISVDAGLLDKMKNSKGITLVCSVSCIVIHFKK